MVYTRINLPVNTQEIIIIGGLGMGSISEHVQYALKELEKLESGEQFTVKDLWKGYEWKRIERPDRLLIGRFFYNAIMEQKPCPVKVLDKTPAKQQKYQKA